MRQRDYEAKALRRIKRITDEASARILRTITATIEKLEREKVEYQIRVQRLRKPKRHD